MRPTPTVIRLREISKVPTIQIDAPSASAVDLNENAAALGSNREDRVAPAPADLWDCLEDFCASLADAPASAVNMKVTLTTSGAGNVRPECVGPLMMIIGEAATNAIKYAHPTRVPGKLHIDGRRDSKGGLQIEIVDDGVGLPEGFNTAEDGSFGFQLMRNVSAKLGADLAFQSDGLGLRVSLRLPLRVCAVDTGDDDAASSSSRDGSWDSSLLNALSAAMYMTDAAGRITFYNEAAAALWGRSPQAGESEPFGAGTLYRMDGSSMPPEESPMAQALRERRPVSGMTAIAERPDGSRVTFASYPAPLFDDSGNLTGGVNLLVDVTEAAAERKRSKERQELIVGEMKHRIRNTLSTVQAVAMETWRSASPEERSAFSARLRALADSHDLLTMDNFDQASLRDIVDRVLQPFSGQHSDRFEIGGPDLRVSGNKSLLLTMALHELATNAAKYGALSNGRGHVQITWEVTPADTKRLRLVWRELDGPPVVRPDKKGFGSFLVERAFKDDSSRAHIEFRPEGVVCSLGLAL